MNTKWQVLHIKILCCIYKKKTLNMIFYKTVDSAKSYISHQSTIIRSDSYEMLLYITHC